MPKKAVILLSGGVDSSTAAALAKAEGYEVNALTFDYAQRHRRELEAAARVADHLGITKRLTIAFDMSEIGGSALTSILEVPKVSAEEQRLISEGKSGGLIVLPGPRAGGPIPVTYVPARNTIFLSFALAWAEVLGAEDIFIGANAVDYSGYPDCRPEYLKAFETMANLSTRASVEGRMSFRINAPLLLLTKGEIIRRGAGLGLDYGLTWSCYDPQPGGRPCGGCDSCLIRAKGFREAGLQDPLLAR